MITNLFAEIRERLRALFFRGREDRELDEELEFHLEMATQENLRRGLAPEEARRQARLRLGGVSQVRESTRDARGIRWVDDIVADIRYALRGFVRTPGFAVAAVLTLGLGIGATTATYSVVHPLLLDPLPFEGGDRLIRLQATDPGFRSEGLYSVRVALPEAAYASEPSRATLRAELLERLRGMPGIDAATIASGAPPEYGFMRGAPEAEGGESVEEVTLVNFSRVHADYFATTGVPILEGRGFTEGEVEANAPVVVISDRMARRLWPLGGAVGGRLRLHAPGQWLPVVGVAGEIAAEGLLRSGPLRLQAHQPYSELSRLPQLGVLLVRATGEDEAIVAQLRDVFRSVAPDVAIRGITSVDAQMARTLAGPRFNAALLSSFAALALVLAAVGLDGVLADAVRRRTREFGIRKAVGAPRGEIVRSVVREALAPVALGTGLGVAGALAAGRVIESQLCGFPSRDPLTLVAVVGVMLATAVIAALVPARLATRVDPMVALRAA
jgi:predicted permease